MKSKHTPGEWQVDGYNLTAVISKIDDIHYKHVCTCDYGYSHPEEHFELNKANAKLISAAPEMLEALQNLITELSPSYNFDERNYPDVMKKAQEAIKKATS